jgi:heme A synthase
MESIGPLHGGNPMFGPFFAMPPPGWSRDVTIAVLVILGLAGYFVWATATREGERKRRLRLALLAILGSPLLGALIAGTYHVFLRIHPLDVADHYSIIIGIGVIVGLILGLFFYSTSFVCSNDPESSRRKSIP